MTKQILKDTAYEYFRGDTELSTLKRVRSAAIRVGAVSKEDADKIIARCERELARVGEDYRNQPENS